MWTRHWGCGQVVGVGGGVNRWLWWQGVVWTGGVKRRVWRGGCVCEQGVSTPSGTPLPDGHWSGRYASYEPKGPYGPLLPWFSWTPSSFKASVSLRTLSAIFSHRKSTVEFNSGLTHSVKKTTFRFMVILHIQAAGSPVKLLVRQQQYNECENPSLVIYTDLNFEVYVNRRWLHLPDNSHQVGGLDRLAFTVLQCRQERDSKINETIWRDKNPRNIPYCSGGSMNTPSPFFFHFHAFWRKIYEIKGSPPHPPNKSSGFFLDILEKSLYVGTLQLTENPW